MEALVPILLILCLRAGLAQGIGAGTVPSDRDAVAMMGETLRTMGPYLVLAFFAAQFIACFGHSRLGEMLAIVGGTWLASLGLPAAGFEVAFVVVVMVGNLVLGSASAKYALFAPVFVPMFIAGRHQPRADPGGLSGGGFRHQRVTPFKPYLIIILAFIRRYRPDAGLGTLLSLMLQHARLRTPLVGPARCLGAARLAAGVGWGIRKWLIPTGQPGASWARRLNHCRGRRGRPRSRVAR
jgi:aminobenzoyl-glutamate transport protein